MICDSVCLRGYVLDYIYILDVGDEVLFEIDAKHVLVIYVW